MSYDNERTATQNVEYAVGEKKISWPMIRHQNELTQTADIQIKGGRIYELQGKKLAEILNALGVIDNKTLLAVEQHHNDKIIKGKLIGQLLIHMGIIDEEQLTRALCIQSGIPMVDLPIINIPQEILAQIPIEQAKIKQVVPVGSYIKTLYLAVATPETFPDKQHFEFFTKMHIKLLFSPLYEIKAFIDTKWTASPSIWID